MNVEVSLGEILPVRPDIKQTETTRFNALKHGVLSRYTVLPWENPEEYQSVVAALVEEHAPIGLTEEHLVEELAGIVWRKRRLRLAEAAAHRRGLNSSIGRRDTARVALVHLDARGELAPVSDAITAGPADTDDDMHDLLQDEAMTRRALDLLNSRRNDAYAAALVALRADTQKWWAQILSGTDEEEEEENPFAEDAQGLRNFIEKKVMPWFDNRRKELDNRPLIREQAYGESLDPDQLGQLGRYEVHLDRKLERTLTMLVRLKELRQHSASES